MKKTISIIIAIFLAISLYSQTEGDKRVISTGQPQVFDGFMWVIDWEAMTSGGSGSEGPQGPAGADGATGPQGPAGADGANGINGQDGQIGATGATGPPGEDGVSGTGFGVYGDSQYTESSPLLIAQGNTEILDIDGLSGVYEDQLPEGVVSFYDFDNSKITPQNVGDGYTFTVGFRGKSNSNNGSATFSIDIGGSIGEIFKRNFRFPRGTSVIHDFYFTSQGYSLGTFVANGGIVKITSDTGDSEISNITIQVHRTHKSKSNTIVKWHVIASAGQSNETGYGIVNDASLEPTDERIKQLSRFGGTAGTLIDAVEPLHHRDRQTNKIGHALPFAMQYLANIPSNEGVVIVPCAQGGSSLADWAVSGTLLEELISRVGIVTALGDEYVYEGMTWLQGEAETSSGATQAQNSDAMIAIFNELRTRLSAPTSWIILGELAQEYISSSPSGVEPMNNAILDLPNKLLYTSVATSEGLTSETGDAVHYDASSQRILGTRYYTQLANAKANNTLPTNPEEDITTGKILELLFEGDYTDTSGNGVTVTAQNMNFITDPDMGSAIESASSTSRVEVPFALPSSWTKYIEFRYDNTGTQNLISSASNDNTLLWINGGTLRVGQTGNFTRIQSSALTIGEVYKAVVTYDGATQDLALYLNGVQVNSVTSPAISGDPNIHIGAWKGTSPFFGPIGDVILYNRSLNQASAELLSSF